MVEQTELVNRLLKQLSAEDFALVGPQLEYFYGAKGMSLYFRDKPADFAFFMEDGIGSIIVESPGGQKAESGIFGREGFAPVSLAMGLDIASYDALIQVPGAGHRLPAAALRAALEQSATLRDLTLRFAQAQAVQTSYTALSNAVHPIDKRLARWILMCHDRIDGNEIALTHKFLSIMLAVRRPSVTTVLHALEGKGFIRAERGCVIVGDRQRLEEFAGDAYGAPEREYERLIGPLA